MVLNLLLCQHYIQSHSTSSERGTDGSGGRGVTQGGIVADKKKEKKKTLADKINFSGKGKSKARKKKRKSMIKEISSKLGF